MNKQKRRAVKLSNILEYESLKRGLTHDGMSKLLDIPRSSITYYIQGKRVPGAATLKKISDKLNIDIATIFMELDKNKEV